MLTTIAAYVLIIGFFVVEGRLRQGQAALSLQPGQADRGSTRLLGAAFMMALVALLTAPALNAFQIGHLNAGPIAGWAGVAIMIGGIGLHIWANRTLGAFYTRTLRTAADQHLVERGPYRVLRHPGYSGSLLMWIGAGLATVNWLVAAVVAIVMLIAYSHRIRAEETMLQQTFDAQYQAYKSHTWKIIPLIY
jgi:protein-S-isoprenylcysteine O-methyltransferase Ste14